MTLVVLADMSLEVLPHGAGADENEVVAGRKAQRDFVDESIQVLEALGLTSRLRPAAPAVADRRIDADVARGSMVGGDIRFDPLEPGGAVLPAGDDRLA